MPTSNKKARGKTTGAKRAEEQSKYIATMTYFVAILAIVFLIIAAMKHL